MTRDEALAELRRLCPPGTTVHTILRHVSRSGMTRRIGAVVLTDGDSRELDYLIAAAGIFREGKGGGLVLGGCGMDMGFQLVYTLSRSLYPGGFGTVGTMPGGGDIRAAGPQHAAELVTQGVKFRGRNGDTSGWDRDGGYALKHRWL